MTAALRTFLRTLQSLLAGGAPGRAEAPDAVPMAAATLLAEVARVDHDVKDVDRVAASQSLQQLFALTRDRADALLEHALRPENRPTSYYSLVTVLNRNLSMQDKVALVEHMWKVAQVDSEIDMYEDHIVRKISDLLYLSHSDFISAKHRARAP